jgi:hypothetical protein
MKISKTKQPQLQLLGAVVSVALIALGAQPLHAADRTWTGGGDQSSWTDAANWGGTAPVASDRLFFGGTTGLAPNNGNTAATIFSNLTFNANAGAFTLSGNSIKLASGSATVGGITNLSANVQTINFTIDNNGGPRVYNAFANDIIVTANINNNTLIKEGTNKVILATTANDSSLGAIVNNGTLVLAGTVATAIGSTILINSNGTVVVQGPVDEIHYNQRINVEQGGVLDIRNTNSLGNGFVGEEFAILSSTGAVSGVVLNNTNYASTCKVGGGSGHKGIFNGTLQNGTGVLNFLLNANGHVQVLNGNSSYSGTTAVWNDQGTPASYLIVNGVHTNGGAYTVRGNKGTLAAPAAFLCGTGLINAASVTVASGAASGQFGGISPGGTLSANSDSGTFSDSVGTLTFSNSVVTFNTNSSLAIQINGATAGTGYDQLVLAGTSVLTNKGANLNLTLGYTPAAGDKITIVVVPGTDSTNNIGIFTALNGVVTDLSQGASFVEPSSGKTFKISYRAEGSTFDMGLGLGNNIMLQVVAPSGGQTTTWRGNGTDNNWDITTTANWWNGTSLTTFTNGDFVTFDNTGSNNTPINIATAVTPTTVLVNATKNFEFGGAGKFTGTVVLTKTNLGKLTITTDNDNLGSTVVQAGTLQIGTNGTTGTLSGSLNIQSNGVVIHNRSDDVTSSLAFTGNGAFVHTGSGAFILNAAAPFTGKATNVGGTFQLGDGSSTVGSVAGDVNVSSNSTLRYYYSGGDVTIGNTYSGTGTVLYDLASGNRTYIIPTTTVNSNFTGTNIINPGVRLHASDGNAGYPLGNGGLVNVTGSGSQVWLDRSATNYNQAFILSGSGWTGDATALGAMRIFGCTVSGPVTFIGDTRIGGTINGGTISGQVSGNYQLEILGNVNSFILSLSNNANSWGNTLVTSGAIRSLVNGSISTNTMTLDLTGELDTFGTTVAVNSLNNGGSGAGVVYNMSTATNGTVVIGGDNSSSSFDGMFGNGSTRALNVTKAGSGTLTLSAVSTNTGTIAVIGGTLALTGSGSFGNASVIAPASGATYDVTSAGGTLTLNNGQTLKGSGNVNGNVTASAGSTINPGDTIGTLTITGNATLSGVTLMELNRTNSPATNDSLVVTGTLTAGGTLTVTNVGPVLHAGDSFKLFSGGVTGFTFNLQTNDVANNVKYTWNNTVGSDGKVSVATVTSLVNTAPTNITTSVSGGSLTLSWPADHIGWTLQVQTNSLTAGLGTNWVDVAGSTTTNQVVIPINAANGSVFYRMKY